MPHHGSVRNSTEGFLEFFVADHYVFSANGKYDNPDASVVEAVVKMHGQRNTTLHFTNGEVTWALPYKLEKNGETVRTLMELLRALCTAYPGLWSANVRKPDENSVIVQLP
jgi:hypothetical protein